MLFVPAGSATPFTLHWKVKGAVPSKPTEKVTGDNSGTVWFVGDVVIVGAVAVAGATVVVIFRFWI